MTARRRSKRDGKPARLTKQRILRMLRDNQELLDRYTVSRIALFGSYATGRQTAKSDIDFLVEFKQPTFDNYMGLAYDLEKLFGRKVEMLTPEGLDSIRIESIAENIRGALTYA